MTRIACVTIKPCRPRPLPVWCRRYPVLAALVLACIACGGSDVPPGPQPGGTLSGKYQLQVKLSASCTPAGATATFPMVMAAAGSTPYPGVQVTLDGAQPGLFEGELKYTNYVLEGGFGTADTVASNEGPLVWIRAIGTGQVTQTTGGKGEVVSGSLRGQVQIGEGANLCTAKDHSFTLRPR